MSVLDQFSLNGKVAVITGGGGLLGIKHGEAISEAGGVPVLWDINEAATRERAAHINNAHVMVVDITDADAVKAAVTEIEANIGLIDILVNNAANDPKVEPGVAPTWTRLENFALPMWDDDIAVGLTGAFLCAQAIGPLMAQRGHGVIVNVASDLSVFAPDQRLYAQEGLADDQQPVKPVTYSVVKHALIGLTKYIATYWADQGVRCNAISPGGVYTNQPDAFVVKLTNLIPMGRMADKDEYKAAMLFLCSDASVYMNGQNLVIDGGRSVL